MAFTDLMIDLETLGNKPHSTVVCIGAVFFDPTTGELGETFDAAIDFVDALRYGKPDGSTLKWWFGQSPEAQKALIRGRHSAVDVWGDFYKFCLKHGKDVHPWGNGASFDLTMCQYQFAKVLDKVEPWQFWSIMDCRTIKRAASGIVTYNGKLDGVAHTALADAIHQAKYVSAYWQGLRAKGSSTPTPAPEVEDDLDLDFD